MVQQLSIEEVQAPVIKDDFVSLLHVELQAAKDKMHQSNVMYLEASKEIRLIKKKIDVFKGGNA